MREDVDYGIKRINQVVGRGNTHNNNKLRFCATRDLGMRNCTSKEKSCNLDKI